MEGFQEDINNLKIQIDKKPGKLTAKIEIQLLKKKIYYKTIRKAELTGLCHSAISAVRGDKMDLSIKSYIHEKEQVLDALALEMESEKVFLEASTEKLLDIYQSQLDMETIILDAGREQEITGQAALTKCGCGMMCVHRLKFRITCTLHFWVLRLTLSATGALTNHPALFPAIIPEMIITVYSSI